MADAELSRRQRNGSNYTHYHGGLGGSVSRGWRAEKIRIGETTQDSLDDVFDNGNKIESPLSSR